MRDPIKKRLEFLDNFSAAQMGLVVLKAKPRLLKLPKTRWSRSWSRSKRTWRLRVVHLKLLDLSQALGCKSTTTMH